MRHIFSSSLEIIFLEDPVELQNILRTSESFAEYLWCYSVFVLVFFLAFFNTFCDLVQNEFHVEVKKFFLKNAAKDHTDQFGSGDSAQMKNDVFLLFPSQYT